MNELESAVEFIKAKDNNNAIKILADLIKTEPKNENAWYLLATCIPEVHKKRYCLQTVLEINPKNLYAIQLLSSLDTKPLSKKSSGVIVDNKITSDSNSVKLISANCPNCGGALQITANTKVTECPFCGHNVIIQDPTRISVEKSVDSEKYLMLAKFAESSWNYLDAYNYYSQIIESNPENVEAWLGKGFTAGMLSSENKHSIKEASDCTHHAFDLASRSEHLDASSLKNLTIKRLDLIASNLETHSPSRLYNELTHMGDSNTDFGPYGSYFSALILAWEFDPSRDKTTKLTFETQKYIQCVNLSEKWSMQGAPSQYNEISVFFSGMRKDILMCLQRVNFEAVAKQYDKKFNLNKLIG